MKQKRALIVSVVIAVLALLLTACPPPTDPQPTLLETMQGSWVATERVPFYGGTLTNTLSLTVSGGDLALAISVSDGTNERNTVALSGSVVLDGANATFTYSGGTQAADNGDGTFDPRTQVALTEADLETIMAEVGGVRTVSVSGSSLTVDAGLSGELGFEKQ